MLSSPELESAEEFVRHTACHVFLTGKAGTGKTTFLHEIRKKTDKRLVVTAPTGVAAINAGGVTLHSFFQLPFGPFVPGSEAYAARHRMRREKKDLIRSLDLLIIDEISMVRADLLDAVDSVLRRYRRTDRPFGGVQLLMIGDLYQLSPVVKPDEWRILKAFYDSPYFFSSTALARTELVPIELKTIFRQTDQRFIELLNRVRDNRLDPATLEALNARHIPGFSSEEDEGVITLCTHNRSADAINRARLEGLPGKARRFRADLEGEFPEQAFPTAGVLELKKGAQVMFIRNDMSPDKAFFNGKIGRITRISGRDIEVRCPGDSHAINVERTTWENIEYSVDPETAEITQNVIGTFSQVPLKPAWAITIHKSQGLTFDKAVIDAQAAFAAGQVYVALSRCRTLEGMVLSSPLRPAAVKTDHAVRRFAAHAEDHPPSTEMLASARSRYQQELLLECFNFERLGGLLGRLASIVRRNEGVIQVSGGVDVGEARRQAGTEICEVGEKFKRQLRGMFSEAAEPSGDPAILERLTKAAAYFEEKFSATVAPCLDDLSVETDNKEVRKQIRAAVKALREEAGVKLAGVLSCGDGFEPGAYLRARSKAAIEAGKAKTKGPAPPVYAEEDVGHPELLEALKEWRRQKAADEGVPAYQVLHQKTLVQIAIHLPVSLTALKKVRGIGKRLAARYGEDLTAMVADYRTRRGIEEVILPDPPPEAQAKEDRPPPEKKPDTRKASLDLLRQGLSIPEIAARRGLVVSTIEVHLADCVARGDLEIGELVPDERRRAIEEQAAGMEERSLSDLKAALGSGFSYGEIRMVLAHLEQGKES